MLVFNNEFDVGFAGWVGWLGLCSASARMAACLLYVSSPCLCCTLGGMAILLYDPMHHVLMGATPRAACTLAVEIFLFAVGLLEDAYRYDKFVHKYRTERLDHKYTGHEDLLRDRSVRSFKLVMNPYIRAVAIYEHQIRTCVSGLCGIRTATGCIQRNSTKRSFCIGLIQFNELTFLEWLKYIRRYGLHSFDSHVQTQTTDAERKGARFDLICKLEDDLPGCLHAVSATSGANFTIPPNTYTAHNSMKFPDDILLGTSMNSTELSRLPLPTIDSLCGNSVTHGFCSPQSKSQYYVGVSGAQAKRIVASLYAADFQTYGFET